MLSLFISDLHLSPNQPAMTRLFLHFLQYQAKRAEALYILGDLFETWIGDDNLTSFNTTIITALAELSASGVAIYFMPGNRDFLVGNRFIQQTGCHYLTDPCVINLYGIPTLLTHGDSFCSLDKKYMCYRRCSRNPLLQTLFLKLPLNRRQKIANRLRGVDQVMIENISKFDVVMDALYQCLKKYPGTELVIHGHTHQPCIQLLKRDHTQLKRFVLSDWHNSLGNALVVLANQTCELIYFT